jgi:hypothetical protein
LCKSLLQRLDLRVLRQALLLDLQQAAVNVLALAKQICHPKLLPMQGQLCREQGIRRNLLLEQPDGFAMTH